MNPCGDLLECCLRGQEWSSDLLGQAIAVDEGRALLGLVVERLGDLFEPDLCEVYARLFTQVIARVAPDLNPRVRPRRDSHQQAPESIARVYVLSRVTLGADVAVTSVLLAAAKRRYPDAEIVFVGPKKNFELFENDPRIRHRAAPYARGGTLTERLRASASLWFDDGIVLDPDSRLSQLGLIAACPEPNYFLFESRSYGGDSDDALPDLVAHWARQTLGVERARPYIARLPSHDAPADITVSLGVGENPAKGLGRESEAALMRMLAATGVSVLVDKGGSVDERQRVEAVLQPGMRTHDGAFAPFAAQIARSKLYIGYDSAGGHVASACGVPLISIAAGFVSDRMRARWRPNGTVILGDHPNVLGEIQRTLARIQFPPCTP
ncbi:MAG TPA: hypothetical protein VN841_20075 [Bryobacteraceae bacterium]|nr:hypothetical protein [Bryobacteraceae bacterium]